MTPKEYLQQYGRIDREIGRLMAEKRHWIDLATRITPTYADAPASGSGGPGRIPVAVERISEWEEKINRKVDQLVDLRQEIEGALQTVEDSRQREILLRRYIQGQKWERIAVEMHLEYRWVLRLHGRALQNLTIKSHPKAMI